MERKVAFQPGGYYHTYGRRIDKQILFENEADYTRAVRLFYICNSADNIRYFNVKNKPLSEIPRDKPLVDIGAWVLMPNHFHLLLHERCEGGISRFFEKFLTAYAMYFNAKYDRSGRLFQNNFQAKEADDDRYLKYLFAYIHLNPLELSAPHWRRDGVSSEVAHRLLAAYPYSSYPDHVGIARDENYILNTSAFPEYFGSPSAFKAEMLNWAANPEELT